MDTVKTIEELFAAADANPPPDGPLRLTLATAELFQLEREGDGWKATYYGPAGSTVAVERVVATLEGAMSVFDEGLSRRDREAAITNSANVVPLVRRRMTDEDRAASAINWTPSLPVVWKESDFPRPPNEPRAYLTDFGPFVLQILPDRKRGGYEWSIVVITSDFWRESEQPHQTPQEAAAAMMAALPAAVAELRALQTARLPVLPSDDEVTTMTNVLPFPTPEGATADWYRRAEWSDPLLDNASLERLEAIARAAAEQATKATD